MQTADAVVDVTKDLADVEITILVYGSFYSFYSVAVMDLAEAETAVAAAMTAAYGLLSFYSAAAETDSALATIATAVADADAKEPTTTVAANSHTTKSWSVSRISFCSVLAGNFLAYILTT